MTSEECPRCGRQRVPEGGVGLTAEEAARMRGSYELWREGTPRKIEGRGIVQLADDEIDWALALLTPEQNDG